MRKRGRILLHTVKIVLLLKQVSFMRFETFNKLFEIHLIFFIYGEESFFGLI